jgi:hypothetical protein
VHILWQAAKLTEIFETVRDNISTDISSGMIQFKKKEVRRQPLPAFLHQGIVMLM